MEASSVAGLIAEVIAFRRSAPGTPTPAAPIATGPSVSASTPNRRRSQTPPRTSSTKPLEAADREWETFIASEAAYFDLVASTLGVAAATWQVSAGALVGTVASVSAYAVAGLVVTIASFALSAFAISIPVFGWAVLGLFALYIIVRGIDWVSERFDRFSANVTRSLASTSHPYTAFVGLWGTLSLTLLSTELFLVVYRKMADDAPGAWIDLLLISLPVLFLGVQLLFLALYGARGGALDRLERHYAAIRKHQSHDEVSRRALERFRAEP